MRCAALFLLLLLTLGGCSRDEEQEKLGPPFFPDARGVVTAVSVDSIQLDGQRDFPVSTLVESFSTYDPKQPRPILGWKNRYVHIGLDESKQVVWIAGIGVVDRSVQPPIVFYTNAVLLRLDSDGNAIFKDGTVLKARKGVNIPKSKRLTISIDAEKHEISAASVLPGQS